MRAVVIVMSSLLLISASHPDKPAFEFKGFVAGEQIDPAILKKCDGRGPAKSCDQFDDRVAGEPAATFIKIYDGRLTEAFALIDREYFTPVLRALEAKYGEPCRTSTSVWQNASGARLDNLEYVWCFRTGELTIQQIGHRLNRMGFYYKDEFEAPPPEATVDF